MGRHYELLLRAITQFGKWLNNFRNNVAGFLDDHRIADADVFTVDFAFVMQGGHLHRTAGHFDRLKNGYRRGCTSPADADKNVLEFGGGLLGGELESHRPTRCFTNYSQATKHMLVVDLDHHAVGIKRQLLALMLPLVCKPHDFSRRADFFSYGVSHYSQIPKRFVSKFI